VKNDETTCIVSLLKANTPAGKQKSLDRQPKSSSQDTNHIWSLVLLVGQMNTMHYRFQSKIISAIQSSAV